MSGSHEVGTGQEQLHGNFAATRTVDRAVVDEGGEMIQKTSAAD